MTCRLKGHRAFGLKLTVEIKNIDNIPKTKLKERPHKMDYNTSLNIMGCSFVYYTA